jgi:transcriptional regulator with XRE-family HTH domain
VVENRVAAAFVFDPTPLRSTREADGRSRKELAADVPCSVSLITLTELGYKRPSVDMLVRMADAYGVSLDDLFVKQAKA